MTFTEPLFPVSERVLYARSPLTQVICQIRFPQILRIESQAPADFQDRIRHAFPILERMAGPGGQHMPPEIAQMLGIQDAGASYLFKTEDEKHTVGLAGGFIALTSDAYTRWEEYEQKISVILQAFTEVYKPSFYTRIGLRYINLIDRSKLDLAGVSWSELLRPELLGELSMPQWEERSFEARRSMRVTMSHDAGKIFFQHGLNKSEEDEDYTYVVDFDFYKDAKTEVGDAAAVLEKFHERSGRAFKWCIRERLHDALGPQQPDNQHG